MSTSINFGPTTASRTSESSGWPNGDTGLRVVSSGINAIFELTQKSLTSTWVVGAPLRLCGVVMAVRSGSCLGFLGHSLAFAALFHPYSRWASIGVDAASECLNMCAACFSDSKTEPTSNKVYSVLGLPPDQPVSLLQLNLARKTKVDQFKREQIQYLRGSFEWQLLQDQITVVLSAYKKLLSFVLAENPSRQLIINGSYQIFNLGEDASLDSLERIYNSKKSVLEAERDGFSYTSQPWQNRQIQIEAIENAYHLLLALSTPD